MISSVRLRNYRNHKDTEIEFGRLTALVGPNSAGKSNVLEGIQCFTRLSESPKSFNDVFKDSRDLDVVVRHGQPFFALRLSGTEPVDWHIEATCRLEEPRRSSKADSESFPSLSAEWTWGETTQQIDSFSKVVFTNSDPIGRHLARTTYLNAIAQNLSAPSSPQEVPPKLDSDGSGLASLISYLMTTEPNRFDRLVERLHDIVPDVEGLRTRPKVPPRHDQGDRADGRLDELLYDMRGSTGVPAHSVSDGTLLATGLLAAVIGNQECEPHFLMVDDLEQGLHPKAQRELVDVLRKILDQRSDLQIVFTTHSPYVVDELAPEETWLLNTDVEGRTHARRLSEHPDAERSLQVLTTGEFWSAEGEDWIVGDGTSGEASAEPGAE